MNKSSKMILIILLFIIAFFRRKTSRLSTTSTKNQPIFVHLDEYYGYFVCFLLFCFLLQNSLAVFFYNEKESSLLLYPPIGIIIRMGVLQDDS